MIWSLTKKASLAMKKFAHLYLELPVKLLEFFVDITTIATRCALVFPFNWLASAGTPKVWFHLR